MEGNAFQILSFLQQISLLQGIQDTHHVILVLGTPEWHALCVSDAWCSNPVCVCTRQGWTVSANYCARDREQEAHM